MFSLNLQINPINFQLFLFRIVTVTLFIQETGWFEHYTWTYLNSILTILIDCISLGYWHFALKPHVTFPAFLTEGVLFPGEFQWVLTSEHYATFSTKVCQPTAQTLFVVWSITKDEDIFVRNVTSGTQNTDMMEHVSSHSSCQSFTISLVLMVGLFFITEGKHLATISRLQWKYELFEIVS